MNYSIRIDRDCPLDTLEQVDVITPYWLNFNTETQETIQVTLSYAHPNHLAASLALLKDYLMEEPKLEMIQRFIIIDDITVMLSDWVYWTENETSLADFCSRHNCTSTGMIIQFPNAQTQTLFVLAYSV